jgi:transcriptional regulator GlxA family with amidase domain
MTTYGIFLYDLVAELDFVGPLQVFAASNQIRGGTPGVVTIAAGRDPLRGFGGLTIVPDATFADAPDVDVLLVPGTGDVEAPALHDPAALAFLAERAGRVAWLAAVCTGTVILQRAGVLRGRKVTSHWMYVEDLAKDPELTVLPDMRYVRDGNVLTSQGISAGIDMALWLVGRLHDPDHARQVRRMLQYDPAPPYAAEV